jgi:hypothetical protein
MLLLVIVDSQHVKPPPGTVDKAICGLQQYSLTKKKHVKLSKTVKFLHLIFNLNHFATNHRFDWEYLTVLTCRDVPTIVMMACDNYDTLISSGHPFSGRPLKNSRT